MGLVQKHFCMFDLIAAATASAVAARPFVHITDAGGSQMQASHLIISPAKLPKPHTQRHTKCCQHSWHTCTRIGLKMEVKVQRRVV
jgi:hypothetical protein